MKEIALTQKTLMTMTMKHLQISRWKRETNVAVLEGYDLKDQPILKLIPCEQISGYTDIDIGTISNLLAFWSQFGNQLPDLCDLSRSLLYIHASTAQVERVFSPRGIIMRPTMPGLWKPGRTNFHEMKYDHGHTEGFGFSLYHIFELKHNKYKHWIFIKFC